MAWQYRASRQSTSRGSNPKPAGKEVIEVRGVMQFVIIIVPYCLLSF
jgi:hypothetical protein